MLVLDSTTSVNQSALKTINGQGTDPQALANFNAFVAKYPVMDFSNPEHVAAAQASCSQGGPSCTFSFPIQPKF